MTQPQMIAGGTIRTSLFVKISTAEDHTLLEADAGEACIGIATEATQDAPYGSVTNAAEAGDTVQYIGIGEEALLKFDASGCTAGDFIKSDADGKGDIAGTAEDIACAMALETVAANEIGRVLVISPYTVPT